ncbi:hypothetical protein [Thermostichus vulcanus]|uniref:Uncharacterized protein n=1 Tax=Thermostichus vulcanus str. 'Rupite' TaxID=2813851 RepID=A0ABT0CES6_THEVL|nr:hypothetical protein [Thermostichus vulcanus]MCJ2544283.1 hypothetical protein [Thermostichus vulcanus str. 'Rupite']
MPPILDPERSYTFSQYFELRFDPADILAELSVTLERRYLQDLPYALPESLAVGAATLHQSMLQYLPKAALTSEMARRELLISPVLTKLLECLPLQLSIEYGIEVNRFLKGEVDYLLRGEQQMIVIEAKGADLSRGITQLAVELIAFDLWLEQRGQLSGIPTLYGAVTTGDIWQFCLYQRREHHILQDLNLYRIPAELEQVMGILCGIVLPTKSSAI